tara:strand:- start:356 stop:553 length:198 start_codon:yes stop_codon:yes gene_type:complete
MNKSNTSGKSSDSKEGVVNVSCKKEIRKEIKARAADQDMTMTEYVGMVCSEHWKKEDKGQKPNVR